jgi:phosphoglycerate dehydrogenase-like enzyme
MRIFRIALTGDFLNEAGESAYGEIGLGLLESAPHVRCRFLREHSPRPGDSAYWSRLYSLELMPEQVHGTEGLIVLRPWVKRGVFAEGAPELVVIGRSGAGYDKIDLEVCTENDVAVFNAPLALNHSTASSALMFMLALAKRLLQQERITRAGRWDLQAPAMGSEIRGRTLGIIGLGHSGRELARLASPFQMRILAYSPHADPEQAAALGVQLTSFEEVLREADFVSLHARLTTETRGMIDAARLTLMQPSAFLINVARGELVDQAALVAALRERRIAGAGLDVFEVEPVPPDDPLLALENVILTPHWSASTTEVWLATGRAMAEGMLRAAVGEVPENVVNPAVLPRPGFRAKLARFVVNRGPEA